MIRKFLFQFLFLFPSLVSACDCIPKSFNDNLLTSNIFSGIIIGKEEHPSEKSKEEYPPEEIIWKVLVRNQWKGHLPDTAFLYSGRSNCDYTFEINQQYLIWGINTSICERTRKYDDSPDQDLLSSIFLKTSYDSIHFTKSEISFIQKRLHLDSSKTALLSKTTIFIKDNRRILKREVIDDIFNYLFDFVTIPTDKLGKLIPEATNGVFVFKDYPSQQIKPRDVIRYLRK